MLNYSEVKPRVYIDLDGEPYEVIDSLIAKKNRNKPHNQTRIKSLRTGKSIERTFHASEKVAEAEIENKNIKYLYTNRGETWFCAENDPKDRFPMDEDLVSDKMKFMKENDVVKGVYFNDEIINIKIPIKVTLVVKESPDAVKGNTSSGATKRIVMENGLEVFVPLFIKEGERLVINTEKNEYVERDNS